MSLAQRFERRLEGLVGGAFARVFKGQVEPVEIGSALQREAADRKNVMGNGQVLCPNRYRVTLSPSDHERLVPWETQLTNSLAYFRLSGDAVCRCSSRSHVPSQQTFAVVVCDRVMRCLARGR